MALADRSEEGVSSIELSRTLTATIKQARKDHPGLSGEGLEALARSVFESLEARGRALRKRGDDDRWFDPAASGLRRGRVERTSARLFRVRDLDAPNSNFYEVESNRLAGAEQGDIVLFRPVQARQSRAKRDERRVELRGGAGRASISSLVEKRSQSWVGLLADGDYGLQFQPFDHRLRFDARDLDLTKVRKAPELRDHDLYAGVYCRLQVGNTRRSSAQGRRGGTVPVTSMRLLGKPTDPNIETTVTIEHFELADSWGEDVLRDEQRLLAGEAPSALVVGSRVATSDSSRRRGGARRDLRELVTCTIDGATARDFDDALSVATEGSKTRLWVHIADVSHYVRPGSTIDKAARARGTSVYFADRAVHMLPEGLSEDLCSLRPALDRNAMTVEMVFDDQGERIKTECYPSLIKSDARLTYRQVEDHFHGETRGKQESIPKRVRASLVAARSLAQKLLELRAERGAFEIEQEVGAFHIGPDGMPTDYSSTPRLFAHRLIEEFMIQTNVAVAEIAQNRLSNMSPAQASSAVKAEPPTFLFRRHDAPKLSAMEELVEQARALGVQLPEKPIESVHDLADLLDSVRDKSIRGLVEGLLLRSLKRAFYTPEQSEHFALGLEAYCHFTSPIRRYPDLVNHRFLKAVLFNDEEHLPTGGHHVGGEELADGLSGLERQAEQAEREQFRWRMVRWLGEREGEMFEVTVSAVQPFGMFVLLDGYGVDGLIPFDDIGDGEVEIVTDGVEAVIGGVDGPTRYRVGDVLQAKLSKADPIRRQLLLTTTQAADERRGRGKYLGGAGGGQRAKVKGQRGNNHSGKGRPRGRPGRRR